MLKKIQSYFNNTLSLEDESDDIQQSKVNMAAAALLIELSRADFQKSPEEQRAIEKALVSTFNLSDSELEILVELAELENKNATSLYEFTKLINDNYSPEQKYQLLSSLWQVAIADGEISKYEDHLIRKIADLIYAPHSAFIKSKLAVLGS